MLAENIWQRIFDLDHMRETFSSNILRLRGEQSWFALTVELPHPTRYTVEPRYKDAPWQNCIVISEYRFKRIPVTTILEKLPQLSLYRGQGTIERQRG